MVASTADDEYQILVDLHDRFREEEAEEQAEFCGRILDGLERTDGT